MKKDCLLRWKWIGIACLTLSVGVVFFSLQSSKNFGPSRFGEIWGLYSFKADIITTAYDSKSGNATIIWLSGLDDWMSDYAKIWGVYSFSPNVVATSYESDGGGATVIWLTGLDDDGNS